jgi:hypothetical protein
VLSFGGAGINNAMRGWGDVLLRAHGKARGLQAEDFTAQYLGFNTDHGAYYYYYSAINGGDMTSAMANVKAVAAADRIPYRWGLIDSWWYYKGNGGGVNSPGRVCHYVQISTERAQRHTRL